MPTPRHHRPGYSLIEIVTVVAVLGIVSAIAIPQFGSTDDLAMLASAREITADLQYAQSRAIATGKTHFVDFDGFNHYRLTDAMTPSPHVILQPTLGTPYEVGFSIRTPQHPMPAEINFDGATTLAFDPTGMPYTWSPATASLSPFVHGSIKLTDGKSTLTITVEPLTGAVNIHRLD
jgi:prepilin-type N-terminal cleavage/methylation domain-containing protein